MFNRLLESRDQTHQIFNPIRRGKKVLGIVAIGHARPQLRAQRLYPLIDITGTEGEEDFFAGGEVQIKRAFGHIGAASQGRHREPVVAAFGQ